MGIWNAIGNVISSGINAWSQSNTNDANARLADRQNQWNLQQWQRENEYNLPANQVQRMREAGLNPDMYYGQNGLMNESAPSPTMERATMYPFQGDFDPINAYYQGELVKAQVDLMNAQADEARSGSGVKRQEERAKRFQNDLNDALSNLDYGEVEVTAPDGSTEVHPVKVNYFLQKHKNELKKQGFDVDKSEYEMKDLLYNYIVLTGVDSEFYSEMFPNYSAHSAALRGSYKLMKLSAEIAEFNKEMVKAESQGAEAFNKWLEKYKDNPVVNLLFILKGIQKSSPSLAAPTAEIAKILLTR